VETVNIRPLGPVKLVVPGADAMFVAKLPNETVLYRNRGSKWWARLR
jgi:hypothetical protein